MARPQSFTDEEILKKARECFLEHGSQISAQHIADEIGISQPALFKRFHTKKNLLIQALKPPLNAALIAELKKGPKTCDIQNELMMIAIAISEHLKGILPAIIVLSTAGHECMVAFKESTKESVLPPPVVAQFAMSAWFKIAKEKRLIKEHNSEAISRMFLGCLQSRAMMSHLSIVVLTKEERDAEIKEFVRLLIQGIGT